MINSFEGKTPQIGAGSYVHPSADVFGNVQIGAGCWIGPGAPRSFRHAIGLPDPLVL
jgi:carbonic anhydrase/acetyltransferase-like protein (isoleucine patch superfamily)